MSNAPLSPDDETLRKQVRRDMQVDLVGNLALATGIWGWFSDTSSLALAWLHEPVVFIPLTATGILNLVHLPARLRRLRDWQNRQHP